ncbi:MAG: hypothetical protein ACRD4W_12740, partial [Nitrososphaeraceae archaeon]
KSIQEKAIAKWLEGKTRDQIARELKISGGSVSAIIKGRRRKDREFDLLRVVAVQLRERNTDVESFSLFIRLRALLKSEYLDSNKSIEEAEEERIDSTMESLIVFCFIRKMSVQEFGTQVHSLYHAADKFGVALHDLPAYVDQLAGKASMIMRDIDLLSSKKERLLKEYEVIKDVIADIQDSGPHLLEGYQKIKARLRDVEDECNRYKTENTNLKIKIEAPKIRRRRKAALKKLMSEFR